MTTYLTSRKIWAYITAGWTDITSDVIKNISGGWGMVDNSPLDLLADTGFMRFTLNNSGGEYSPYLVGALAGWGKGTPIKLVVSYDGEDYVRFRGVVINLDIQSGTVGGERVSVTVADWLDYAATHPLLSPGIQTDKRGDQVLTTIVDGMPIQPQATDFDEGVNVFPTVFDNVTTKTKAYSEMSKIAFSEIGYVYLKKDRTHGETLVFESAEHRHGLREPAPLPKAKEDSGFFLKEDGGCLLLETGGKIVLNEATTFVADNVMQSLEVEYGENVINRFTNLAYPRRVDTDPQVLFSLGYPMQIGSGETIVFRGNYADPSGGSDVSGMDMIEPLINVDYKVWTTSGGGGIDITADLVIAAVYGTEGVTYTLTNGSVHSGWITLLNARGYGIYTYNPIEHAAEDQASIDEFGYQWETLHQKYQQDLTRGSLATASFLEQEKRPRTKLNKIHMVANRSGSLMMAFLNLDVGDLIHVKEDKTGVDEYDYIQGVEFTITPGGVVRFAWIVKGALSLLLGLSLVSCEFCVTDPDGVNFGYLPQVSNLDERSFSAWVYITDTDAMTVMGPFSDAGGCIIYIANGPDVAFYIKGTTGVSNWWTTGGQLSVNTLHHILVTGANSTTVPPVVYVDGVPKALTEGVVTESPPADETGSNFVIGNIKTVTVDYTWTFDGLIKDVRVYNVNLTADEAEDLAAGENVTRGLVFQTFCVRTRELADFEDKVLTPADKMIENMFGVVGTPHGSVISRLIP